MRFNIIVFAALLIAACTPRAEKGEWEGYEAYQPAIVEGDSVSMLNNPGYKEVYQVTTYLTPHRTEKKGSKQHYRGCIGGYCSNHAAHEDVDVRACLSAGIIEWGADPRIVSGLSDYEVWALEPCTDRSCKIPSAHRHKCERWIFGCQADKGLYIQHLTKSWGQSPILTKYKQTNI